MGFFDAPEPTPEPPSFEVPDEVPVIGGAVPLEVVLGRSDEGAIVLRGVVAYPDGMELTVVAVRRHQQPPSAGYHHLPFDVDLRIGLQYADGRELRSNGWVSPGGADGGIRPDGGGGGGQIYEQRLWVWPLPPPGEMAVVVQWTELGIDETWTRLDAGPIREAASRAAAVWPEDLGPGESPTRESRAWLAGRTVTSHFAGVTDDVDEERP